MNADKNIKVKGFERLVKREKQIASKGGKASHVKGRYGRSRDKDYSLEDVEENPTQAWDK